MDKLEFFIPYYNAFDYLTVSLLSLKNQNCPHFKVTVVDDGSSDNRAEVFISEMNDTRFSYINNFENLGLARNFQICVNRATSDWVVILGQDDRMPPNFVCSLSSHLHDYSIGFIQPKVTIINQIGEVNRSLADSVKTLISRRITENRNNLMLDGAKIIEAPIILPWFFLGNPFYFPTIVWNRSVLQEFGFNQSLPITLDYDLIFRILNSGFKVKFLSDTTAEYRRHSESASGRLESMSERLEEETRVLKSFGRYLNNPNFFTKLLLTVRPIIRFHALVLALGEFRSAKIRSSMRYLGEFFKI